MISLLEHWPAESDWTSVLDHELKSDWFRSLSEFVAQERSTNVIFPSAEETFNAFRWTAFSQTRVVILGQDPYHGPGQAHGLCFSVPESVTKLPPSLKNIYKELSADIECSLPTFGNLETWAKQGVLLLNTVLTVQQAKANSHRKRGWERFTDSVIEAVGQREQPCIFILWGKPAEKKSSLIHARHEIIVSPHPSPLSAHRGFFDSKPFSRTNDALAKFGQPPIQWNSVCE